MRGLDTATKDAANRTTFDELNEGAAAYRQAFHQATALAAKINGLVNGMMSEMGLQVQRNTGAISHVSLVCNS